MSGGGALDAMFRDRIIGTTAAPSIGFTHFGETVTHTAPKIPGTTPVATVLTAARVATPDVIETDIDEQTKWVVAAADITPLIGDTITDDAGVVWGVRRVTPQEGGVYELTTISAQEQ